MKAAETEEHRLPERKTEDFRNSPDSVALSNMRKEIGRQQRRRAVMRSVVRFLLSGLLVGLFLVIASGQAIQTGGITGIVMDKNGALVAGATVSVINETTGGVERTA